MTTPAEDASEPGLTGTPPKVPILVDPVVAPALQRLGEFLEECRRACVSISLHVGPPALNAARVAPDGAGFPVQGRRVTAFRLASKEQEEALALGFKSLLPIHISGRLERRESTVVEVGGLDVALEDAAFCLFLRLVVGLFEAEDGFVDRGKMREGGGLIAEGFYVNESIDQAVSRLRHPFRTALGALDATDFIEVRRGRVRLSTHPCLVSWNRKALLSHPRAKVRELAERLPDRPVPPATEA